MDARKDQKAGIRKGDEAVYEKGSDVEGHHLDPVKDHEEKMTDPRNIKLLHKRDHQKEHENMQYDENR